MGPVGPSVKSVKALIEAARARLDSMVKLPVKSEVDHQLIADLKEYIAGLKETLAKLTR